MTKLYLVNNFGRYSNLFNAMIFKIHDVKPTEYSTFVNYESLWPVLWGIQLKTENLNFPKKQ